MYTCQGVATTATLTIRLLYINQPQQTQRSLGGFHAAKSTFSLPPGLDLSSIPDKVLQSANLSLITSMSLWEKEKVAYFASLSKKKTTGGGRIVAQVSLEPSSQKLTLQMNGDDAMMSATLHDVVKRGLTSTHPIRALGGN